MSLAKRIKNIFFPDEFTKLIRLARRYPRYKSYTFKFRNYIIGATDFLSVAWQIKEIFGDEELKFNSTSVNPVIYDCGANVGISTMYFRKIFPSAKIKSFEPDDKAFKYLNINLEQNNIKDVEIFREAVWTEDGMVEFGSDGADGGSVFHNKNRKYVKSVHLKKLLESESKIDFLKMDIEGPEVIIFNDCKDQLNKIDKIFVEYHSWKDKPQQLDLLLQLLTENGFRYYIRSIGSINSNPFINNQSDNPMDIQLNIHAIRQ